MADDDAQTKFDGATPVFLVSDIAATMRWYATRLGFDVHGVPEAPPHTFGFLRKDNVEIFLQQFDGYRKPDLYDQREGGVWSVYLQVQGVRQLFAVLSQMHDVTMLEPLCHQPYGQTEFVIRDPNGYALVFAQRD
jgi:catechol 2,3-dioxygenase-like lactoylglutathione lyase family enzyme